MFGKNFFAALGLVGLFMVGTVGSTAPASAQQCGPWNDWCAPGCGSWNNWCQPACGEWNAWCVGEILGSLLLQPEAPPYGYHH